MTASRVKHANGSPHRRPSRRVATVSPSARLHRRRGPDVGVRPRRQHRHLYAGRRAAPAIPAGRPAGGALSAGRYEQLLRQFRAAGQLLALLLPTGRTSPRPRRRLRRARRLPGERVSCRRSRQRPRRRRCNNGAVRLRHLLPDVRGAGCGRPPARSRRRSARRGTGRRPELSRVGALRLRSRPDRQLGDRQRNAADRDRRDGPVVLRRYATAGFAPACGSRLLRSP